MKKQLTRVLLATSMAAVLWSCNQSDPAPKGDYVRGVFAINEGNFTQNNGAISYFAREQNTAEADLFSKVNGRTLGGGVQGYTVQGETGLILVDNTAAGQDKIEIVNSNTFESVASLGAPDIENPREVVTNGANKAYITCWGANPDYSYKTGYIAIVDLTTNKVIKKINIASGPENLIYHNNKVYVGVVSYGGGKSLTVINTTTDEVAQTVNFDASPAPVGIDANGKLWLSAGSRAVRINADSYAAEANLVLTPTANKSAGNLELSADGRTIYYVLSYYDANFVAHGETYKFGIADTQVNTAAPFINRYFTGLTVDPAQGLIYAAVTPSYAQAGYAIRYRTDGTLVDSIRVGVAPTGFYFR
ncbi:DUF5074 domain-containing protein [Dyadobacter sandarakinus]|uniref:40-residue YVTN family beta-propeller repeat-containing protein n=1 Tax=Dyadobacter sandarakinus TaxID=2747268 RepID=A0ABX7IA14_9BACT|nr:DUF5074 domain-containing protein [Dyadobacter sandarakinus]QRR02563.1 hypothetical protein HWI92_17435 [Dyadobacter sandarakinus]